MPTTTLAPADEPSGGDLPPNPPTATEPPAADTVGLGDLLRPVRSKLILAAIIQAIGAVVVLVPFVLVAELGRELLSGDPADGRLWNLAIIAAVALVARLVCLLGASAITHFADNDLQLDLRRRIAERLGRAPLGWFDDRDGGEVKKVVVDDVHAMHQLVGHTITDIVAAIVTPVAAMIYLFTIDWRLALAVLLPFVVGAAMMSRMYAGYGDKMTKYNDALADVNVGAVEFVQGIAVVKTFGQAGRAHRRFLDAADALVDYFWEWVRGLIRGSSVAEVLLSPLATLTVIAGVGTALVADGSLEPVDTLPFFLVGLALTAPMLTLGVAMDTVQRSSDAAGRVAAFLEIPQLPMPEGGVEPVDGTIRFEDVAFSYDGERRVLDGVDLTFAPGTLTALVGPSGSGKSTIGRLICRFWDPAAGRVTLGGVDLRHLDADVLYEHVGFVFQDVQLLRASVADNIRLARPDATMADVERAARAAQIHERILELPNGYDTVVGVDAVFSGGEAQRVSIARAIITDAPLLVLDEATSFADPDSEAAIQDALAELIRDRTVIVIAHRLSTIVGADRIVVLDAGRVAEQGTHDELLALDGHYAAQWRADQRARAVLDADDAMPVAAGAGGATTTETEVTR